MNAPFDHSPTSDSSAADSAPPPRTISGRVVVLGMVLFGVTVTGALGLYWEFYTRPFRALQTAIDAEFPGSNPRVIGGRHRSRNEVSAATLRIVIQVDFNPLEEEDQAQAIARQLADLTFAHHDLSPYEILEIHLYESLPEDALHLWSQARPVAEWRSGLEP